MCVCLCCVAHGCQCLLMAEDNKGFPELEDLELEEFVSGMGAGHQTWLSGSTGKLLTTAESSQ